MEEKPQQQNEPREIEIQGPEETGPEKRKPAEAQEAALHADLENKFKRLAADFANYKKRVGTERAEWHRTIERRVLSSVLPLYDDFYRLVQNAQNGDLKEGVRAVHDKWRKWLEQHRIRVLNPVGEPFDPHFHDAVLQEPVSDPDRDSTVTRVLEVGYLRGDEVLRHAKVVVGRYQAPGPAQEPQKGVDEP